MNYARVEKLMLGKLQQELSDKLCYHNVRHTCETIKAATEFCQAEGLSETETTIVKTAALLHDSGYLRSPLDNERIGAEIAREILPRHGYTPEQVGSVCRLILATKMPQHPVSLDEQILCDADLQYLGTQGYGELSGLLRREMSSYNISFSDRDWLDFQINFLKNHHYFTRACRQARETVKAGHLQQLLAEQKHSANDSKRSQE